jgi:hypothetical protein
MTELADNASLEGAEIPEQETDAGNGTIDTGSQDSNLKTAVEELKRARDEKARTEPEPRPFYSDATGKALVPEIPDKKPSREIDPLSVSEAAKSLSDWREQKAGKSIGYEEYIQSMLDAGVAGQSASTDANAPVAAADHQQPPPVANELPQPQPDASIEERRAALEAQRQQLSQQWQQNVAQYDVVIPHLRAVTDAGEADWEAAAASLNIKTAADYQNLRAVNPSAFDALERARNDIHNSKVLHDSLIAERANTIQFAHEQEAKVAREQHVQWANEQDRLFIEAHPEFANPKQAAELQDGVVRFLRSTGMSDAEIVREWNTPGSPMRSHKGQALLAVGGKNYATLENARAAKPLPKNLPPVQRPGMRPETPSSAYSEVSRYDRQLSSAKSQRQQLEAAARLLGAARRANSR